MTLLAIHSYPGGNAAMERHWEYFQRQGADEVWGIGTTDGKCKWPQDMKFTLDIGANSYIDGPHLALRLVDTVHTFLPLDWDILMIAEYDTVFFNRIPVEKMKLGLAGYMAGGKTWGSKAEHFYHNPWLFRREIAPHFVELGRKAIEEGVCPGREPGQAPVPDCSPDVFFGFIAEELALKVQDDLWTEFSRNSLDRPGDLKEAQKAFRAGVDIIHGIKTKHELEYITKP